MAQKCKGLCTRYKAKKPKGLGSRRYAAGQKRCIICEIYIDYEGIWCPCCGYRLRAGPRKRQDKEALRELQKAIVA